MNKGNIPGYYYDEEKNKYFRIQPNHIAPSNAKYSISNVKQEQRANKKLKLEQHQQAIKRTGFQREQGRNVGRSYDVSRDGALVNGFECRKHKVVKPADTHAGFQLFDYGAGLHNDTGILALRNSTNNYMLCHREAFDSPEPDARASTPLHAFRDQITYLAIQKVAEANWLLACSSEANLHANNVFITRLHPADDFSWLPPSLLSGPSLTLGIGQRGETNWASRLLPGTDTFAMAGSHSVSVCSMLGQQNLLDSHALAAHEESVAVDWLGAHTLAFSIRTDADNHPRDSAARHHRHPPRPHNNNPRHGTAAAAPTTTTTTTTPAELLPEVRLWDTRSHGIATRLHTRSRITGLEVPDRLADSPAFTATQLLVADVHGLALYDLRFTKTTAPPVFRIEHQSQGDRLGLTTLPACQSGGGGGIVAALDEGCQAVETYSLRDGTHIRTLKPDEKRGDWRLSGLRWREDECGVPFLQACVGASLQQWGW